MKFLVDAQLPPALATALRQVGCEALAARDLGLHKVKDGIIWQYARQNGDEDFAERCMASIEAPVVIWLRIGNATNPELLNWFMPLLPAVLARIQAGDQLIEVR